MKLTDHKGKEQTELHKQAEQQKGQKYVGSQRIHPGHTLFSFNLLTGEVKRADIEETIVLTKSGLKKKQKVITEENCQYLGALNEKSLTRKLTKFGFKVKTK